MNRKIVSDGHPSLNLSSTAVKTPFMKVHSIGDKLIEKYSPIVKIASTETKKKTSVKRQQRSPWTKPEDDRLVALIEQERSLAGDTQMDTHPAYATIAARLNSGRTAKQCRDRWKNILRGGIKKGDWTVDEEELIKDLYASFGAKWSVMAKLFKDRTDNDIKNKWYAMKRKDARKGLDECTQPFAAITPMTVSEVDYSTLGQQTSIPSFLAAVDLQTNSSDRNDSNKGDSSDDNVTAV